jgi:hypothetical protein
VSNGIGADDEDLRSALYSYVLSGALKLFRQAKTPNLFFRHHTMLIHTSASTASQNDLAERVIRLWNKCTFNAPSGLAELEKLWQGDFSRVSTEHAQGHQCPQTFDVLIPFLAQAIGLIERGQRCVMVVNYNSKEAPDFGEEPVWKIIIGGNKLSRGYTVEGLTISYYRRVASTADTLMQMGRWFGFREGYQDLVRVFLGVREGRKENVDLVAQFKQVCTMEERFRQELKRYVRAPSQERKTPKQIPPLISVVGDLAPTSRNKMFNAILKNRNFGGSWSQPTQVSITAKGQRVNRDLVIKLLNQKSYFGDFTLGGKAEGKKSISMESRIFQLTNQNLIQFLTEYRWFESKFKYPDRPPNIHLQLEFLEKQRHGIESWLVIAPQRMNSFGDPFDLQSLPPLTAKHRRRLENGLFRNFGEPDHRIVAEFLTGLSKNDKEHLASPNDDTKSLFNRARGIMLLYPVREQKEDDISIGFEILYPSNSLRYELNFTVQSKSDAQKAIIAADSVEMNAV